MSTAPDLARLNDAERRILTLLAEGHTAKSIAVETGRTEGAVNERLREARRKTGVGSSRELARLVRAQENRDEEIGVAEFVAPASTPARASSLTRWQGKMLLMTIPLLSLTAAALTMHALDRQATPQPPQPPVASSGEYENDATIAIRATFAKEMRAPGWANAAEAALHHRYTAIRGIDPAALDIACHTTLCSVTGRSASGIGAIAGKRAEAELESPALRRSVPGLHADVTRTGSYGDSPAYRFEFSAMWRRLPG